MDATATALQPGTALEPGTDLVDAGSQAVAVGGVPEGPLTPLQRIAALPPRQKWVAGAGIAMLLTLMVALSMFNESDRYAPLFTGAVTERDAGAAIEQLKQLEIPYRIGGTGQTILVPSELAGELRMRMASSGLPKGSVSGFELLDNPRFGMSQQQERTSLQRALEGELTRSVRSLAAVEDARVHLAMPQPNGFFREKVKPSASVIVTLRPGHILDRNQIAGILHLVSSSVPDLSPKAVSVIDQDGSLLSQSPDGESRLQDLTQQQRKHVQETEQTLLRRVNEILEPALGKENLRATVTAELDFTQIESTSEAYGPNQGTNAQAIRSERQIEANGTTEQPPAGVPGAAANVPPQQATAPLTGEAQPLKGNDGPKGTNGRKESQVNYEVDRKVQMMRNAIGSIKRVNVAVVVNHRETTDPKGKTSTEPVPQAELDQLTALVQEAVGYSAERGDRVKVISMPFRADLYPKPEALPWWKEPWVLPMAKTVGAPLAMLLIALTLVFAVIRPALKKEEPPEPEGLDAMVDDPEALPGEGESAEPTEEDYAPFVAEQLQDARMLAQNNPLAVANILRTWMHGEEATA